MLTENVLILMNVPRLLIIVTQMLTAKILRALSPVPAKTTSPVTALHALSVTQMRSVIQIAMPVKNRHRFVKITETALQSALSV